MVLEAKRLEYRVVEITPGIGQLAVFRLSGQRQVPVLVDGDSVLADSSAIIRHLETCNPEPILIPENQQERGYAHLIEDWADTTLANAVRATLLQAAANDPDLRIALVPEDVPESLRQVFKEIPCGIIGGVTELLSQGEKEQLLMSLKELCNLIESCPYLVGDSLSIADIAVASQLSLLKFPTSSGSLLQDKGCPGFKDNPSLHALFHWRDQIEDSLFHQGSIEV